MFCLVELVLIWFFPECFFPPGFFDLWFFPWGMLSSIFLNNTYVVVYAPSSCFILVCSCLCVCVCVRFKHARTARTANCTRPHPQLAGWLVVGLPLGISHSDDCSYIPRASSQGQGRTSIEQRVEWICTTLLQLVSLLQPAVSFLGCTY